jgi:hypothetical protein
MLGAESPQRAGLCVFTHYVRYPSNAQLNAHLARPSLAGCSLDALLRCVPKLLALVFTVKLHS